MDITKERLIELIRKCGKTKKEIASEIGVSVTAINKHTDGSRNVSSDFIVKYAKYFNVSCDYLLGASDVATVNTNLRDVCDYTGLSEKAVKNLNVLSKTNGAINPLDTINKLIEGEDYIEGSGNISESGKYVFTMINAYLNSSLKKNVYYVFADGMIQNATDRIVTTRDELDTLKYYAEDGMLRDFAKREPEKIVKKSSTPSMPAEIFENALIFEINKKLSDMKNDISNKEV